LLGNQAWRNTIFFVAMESTAFITHLILKKQQCIIYKMAISMMSPYNPLRSACAQ